MLALGDRALVRDDHDVVGGGPARTHRPLDRLEVLARLGVLRQELRVGRTGLDPERRDRAVRPVRACPPRRRSTARRSTGRPAASHRHGRPSRRGAPKLPAKVRAPSSVRTAGMTTTAAPTASRALTVTPVPIECRFSVGPMTEARNSEANSPAPAIRIARPVLPTAAEAATVASMGRTRQGGLLAAEPSEDHE